MNPIQYQAVELWQTLLDKETILTFKKATTKFWQLLKQTGRLIFLLALLWVAVVIWFWGVAFHSGRDFRFWLENERVSPGQLLAKAGEIGVTSFEFLTDWSKRELKELLGLERKALPPAVDLKALPGESEESVREQGMGNRE